MSELKITNAVIRDARLFIEDHGILTIFLTLDYGGSCQGFGGYCLYSSKWKDSANSGSHFIKRVFDIAGVSDWSQLEGKTIRAKTEHEKCHAIGHIINDDWFNPSEDFKDLK